MEGWLPHLIMADSWFLHVWYDQVAREVVKDCVRLESLEMALDCMLEAHVQKGWKIREERQGKRNSVEILGVWKPYISETGTILAKRVYPRQPVV